MRRKAEEHYDPIRDLRSQPENSQLNYAIELIRYYSAHPEDGVTGFYMTKLEMPMQMARLLSIFMKYPMETALSGELLNRIMWADSDLEDVTNNLAVAVNALRKYLPEGVSVPAVHGWGYQLIDPQSAVPVWGGPANIHRPRVYGSAEPWPEEDDNLLILLRKRGKGVAQVAIVLDRSARSVSERYKIIKRRHGLDDYWR